MAAVSTVREAVKDSLIGTKEPVQLSVQTKARFNSFAIKDAETGDHYMGPDEFINAVAPPAEDYVSSLPTPTSLAAPVLAAGTAS